MRGANMMSSVLKWGGLLVVAYLLYYVIRNFWPMQ